MAATKRRTSASLQSQAITTKRAARLYQLLVLLGDGPQMRSVLIRRLRLDVRGFYRDLELLRATGIHVVLQNRRYHLEEKTAEAVARLPFPDPRLTLGEARELAKGRTVVHRKMKELIRDIIP